jgi:hypothetical protein
MNTENQRVRMRSIPKAYEEIKKIDPDTSFSMRALRRLVGSGEIPTVKISNKVLINLDLLLDKLACYNESATCA